MGLKEKMQQAAEQAKSAATQATQNIKPQGGTTAMKASMKDAGKFGRKSFATLVERIDPGLLATFIIKATAAQEKANEALKEKGSLYRISEITITATIPPQIGFSIARGDEVHDAVESTQLVEQGVVEDELTHALDPEVDAAVDAGEELND
jgi:hypothetical protein